MIDSRKLARVRRRVVGGYLSELGYSVSGKEYLAKVGPHLRYVSFSAAKYGKAFDVSIALHFEFLPPFNLLFGLARPSQARCAVSSAGSNV
jgi:hypothetical protein